MPLERSTWTTIGLHHAPRAPGTYAIFRGKQLLYVGSASNLKHRMAQQFPNLRWSPTTSRFGNPQTLTLKIRLAARLGDHLRRELRLIARLRPPFNRRL